MKCQERFGLRGQSDYLEKVKETKDCKGREMCPSRPDGTELTNVHLVICLSITYALKLELLQGLGELLDGSRKICKMRGSEHQNKTCRFKGHIDEIFYVFSRQQT